MAGNQKFPSVSSESVTWLITHPPTVCALRDDTAKYIRAEPSDEEVEDPVRRWGRKLRRSARWLPRCGWNDLLGSFSLVRHSWTGIVVRQTFLLEVQEKPWTRMWRCARWHKVKTKEMSCSRLLDQELPRFFPHKGIMVDLCLTLTENASWLIPKLFTRVNLGI
jgi:hypothetical protein